MDPKAVQTLGMPAADIQRRARALKMEYLRESFGNMAAASSEYASFRSKLTKAAEQLQAIDAGQFLAGTVPCSALRGRLFSQHSTAVALLMWDQRRARWLMA